jgi:uncharacterized protein
MKLLFAVLVMLGAASGSARTVSDRPRPPKVLFAKAPPLALTGRIVDAANLLGEREELALSKRLAALEKATSDQLVVVTVAGLEGDTIEHYTLALGNRWGIGRADIDNGVIILVAPVERKVRIEVGLGLEGLLTDAKAGEMIRTAILPRFVARDFPGGIAAGVDRIDRLLRSDVRRPQPKPARLKEAA